MPIRKRAAILTEVELIPGKEPDGAENEGESRYRQMFEKNPAVQLLVDPETGAIVDANPGAVEFYGYDLSTLRRTNISAINTLPRAQIARALTQVALERQQRFLFQHRLASGEIRDVEVSSCPVMLEGRQLLHSIIHDVTRQKRADAALRHQIEFEKLVASVSRLFLNLPPEEVDSGIRQALQSIGEFVGVDRSYFYLVSSDLTAVNVGYEWCAPGVRTELGKTLALSIDAFSWSRAQMLEKEVLHVPRVADLPPEAGVEKAEFEAQGVQSALLVPLISSPFLGFLGFDVVKTEKTWSDESMTLLKIVREIIAHALQRKRTEEARREEAQVAAALARVGQELIASLDTSTLLERVCQLTAEVLQCEYSRTFLRQAEGDTFIPVASFGDTPDQWEAFRLVETPARAVQTLLARLERENVVEVTAANVRELLPATLTRQSGAQAALCLALRRGNVILGVQSAGYRTRTHSFSLQQKRIAYGIAQIASLALENARLFDQAEQANRLKSDFLATMSHELRTPLNIIIGYTDMLLEGDCGSLATDQANILRRVSASSRELLELINSTLDVSRFEAGRLPLELQAVEVVDFLRELERETANRIIKPGVTVEWRAPSTPLRLRTDRAKLKVVVKNLLGNALKFTEQGTIRIEAHAAASGVEIVVSDTGIGIPADVLPVIFDMFRQGDGSATRRYGGVGLGLYIVRRLLDLLGGTVSVESEVGRGSTFRVWLPN